MSVVFTSCTWKIIYILYVHVLVQLAFDPFCTISLNAPYCCTELVDNHKPFGKTMTIRNVRLSILKALKVTFLFLHVFTVKIECNNSTHKNRLKLYICSNLKSHVGLF